MKEEISFKRISHRESSSSSVADSNHTTTHNCKYYQYSRHNQATHIRTAAKSHMFMLLFLTVALAVGLYVCTFAAKLIVVRHSLCR